MHLVAARRRLDPTMQRGLVVRIDDVAPIPASAWPLRWPTVSAACSRCRSCGATVRPHGYLLSATRAVALLRRRTSARRSSANHLGVALDRHVVLAELAAAQQEIVHELQEAVLPPPPRANTELGRYYVGAESAFSTGGDIYDWIILPDGELHFAVVDIMGKGVSATKDALTVTHALRLLALEGCALEDWWPRPTRSSPPRTPSLWRR